MAKDKGQLLRTVFSLVLRDPTCKWDKIRSKKNVVRSQEDRESPLDPLAMKMEANMVKEDRRAGKSIVAICKYNFSLAQDLVDLLKRVHCFDPDTKKRHSPSSYLDLLIKTASSDEKLYQMYRGWMPHM